MENALVALNRERQGEFVVILVECWNARNLFIFQAVESYLVCVSQCIVALARSSYEIREQMSNSLVTYQQSWLTPPTSFPKLYDDDGKPGDSNWGWPFVLCD